eukprot:jgi/Undpi1/3857/HiC_scaffold_16.g07226.m2
MDSAVRRMSSFAFLPFLAVLFAANCAVGFIAPSVHVAPSRPVSPSAWQGVRHATCRSRCRVRSESGLRWRGQAAGLSMVDPHVLRLQAAELGSRLKGTNVFFVGMMGTGKSTIARSLADVMGRYIFLDTDSIIEELLGASVGEVFATDGEEAFRSVESQVLDQVHSYVKTCIATGGGIVTEAKNWGRMQTGVVVWLDMESKDILDRLMKDPEQVAKRPLLAGDDPKASLDAIMEKRRSQYAQADVTVQLEAGDNVEEATLNVINSVLAFIDSNPPKWRRLSNQPIF